MKLNAYPSLRYLVFLIIGIVISSYISLTFSQLSFIIISLVGIFIFTFSKPKYFNLSRHFIPVIFLLLGILAVKLQNKPNQIKDFAEVEAYLVNIASATESKPKSYKVLAEVLAVKTKGKWKNTTGQSLLYFMKNADVFPEYDQIFLIKGKPRIIEAPKNPFEFNYKLYQERKGVFTHQFLRKNQFVLVGQKHLHPIYELANQLSLYTHQLFKTYMSTPAELGVAEALVAGIRSEIDQSTIQAYADTGAIHILSVSGGHVGILLLVLNFIFSKFLDRKKITLHLFLIVLLWGYALFTGLSPSVCRATLMFSLFQIGTYLNRDKNTINTLAWSALFLLLVQPNWLYDVGFQLSNLAVLGILVIYPKVVFLFETKYKLLRDLWEISLMAFSATLFTFPLSIYYFHQFPNLFLLSNPVVSVLAFLIVPAGILLIVVGKIPVLNTMVGISFNFLISLLNRSILFFQSLPFSVTKGLEINNYTMLLLYIIIALSILFLTFRQLKYLKYATLLVLGLSIFKIFKVFKQNQQKEITFHYIPNEFGLSIIQGRKAQFIAQDSSILDPLIYQFHLKNYYDHLGVNKYFPIKLSDQSALNIKAGNIKIQWLKNPSAVKLNTNSDYILSSNNALNSLSDLAGFKGKIIIDGSNKKWVVEKLKNEAIENNLDLVSLYDVGSQTIKMY